MRSPVVWRSSLPPFWRLMPQGMRRRWWLFRLFDGLARYWPVFRSRRGVLVIRMDGIGDMILFRNNLDHYADAFGVSANDITLLGCDSWASIAGDVFDGYRVTTINEHRYARRFFYRLKVNFKFVSSYLRLPCATLISAARLCQTAWPGSLARRERPGVAVYQRTYPGRVHLVHEPGVGGHRHGRVPRS